MQRSQPDGLPVTYAESGSGYPILLVHGRLNDSRLWAQVAGRLAARYRAIRCDLRTESTSFTPAGADHAARLLALLDSLGLARAHLVSHGAGWSWIADLAVRAPNRVASLTVVDPVVPRVEESNAVQEAWHLEMLLQWLAVSHGAVVRKPEHATALAAVVAQQTHGRMGDIDGPLLMPTGGNELPPMTGIRCPVLALVGQGATPEAKALVASVFGQVQRFELDQVAGAVRHCPLEAPDVVADLLERFLASCA